MDELSTQCHELYVRILKENKIRKHHENGYDVSLLAYFKDMLIL